MALLILPMRTTDLFTGRQRDGVGPPLIRIYGTGCSTNLTLGSWLYTTTRNLKHRQAGWDNQRVINAANWIAEKAGSNPAPAATFERQHGKLDVPYGDRPQAAALPKGNVTEKRLKRLSAGSSARPSQL